MIQFSVLSGRTAGSDTIVRHFPFLIGRSTEADLRLENAGIWDRHLGIQFQRGHGFLFSSESGSTVLVNHERVESGLLRNGDLIELGSVQLRFWLAPGRQKSTGVREVLTWAALMGVFVAQIGLVYWLLR